jgi:hypothetical protein
MASFADPAGSTDVKGESSTALFYTIPRYFARHRRQAVGSHPVMPFLLVQ